jgi:glycosyltransferase involved in cell wall biosynthesis
MRSGKIKVALMSYAMDNRAAKGTALYTRKLIEGILDDDRFDFYLVHYDKVSDPLYKKAHEIILPRIKLPLGSRFVSQLLFFWKYRKDKFDIIHWFQPRVYPFFWLAPAKKIIVTMHGAGDITAPQHFIFSRSVFNFVLVHFHGRVSMVIADSESAKSEIVKHYGFSQDKVASIYLGGGENYKPIDKNESRKLMAQKYGIKQSYILDVARLQPHKNIISLIKAYELLRKNNKEINAKLVIVGKPTSSYVEEYEIAKKSKFSTDILFIGYVDIGDLNAVYSGSEVFVFPSLSEGFGLPVLEAMASGAPVITSNIDSMPEIGGKAVIAVNPLNINELADAMRRVLTDENLKEKMIELGLKRAKEFTWKSTAEQTKNLYVGQARKN